MKFPKKGPDILPLKEQLKAILSFKLMISSSSVLEKLFWFVISFGGTVYIIYILTSQFSYWEENATLITKGSKPLSDVKLPAVTFCHKGMQKYAIAEKLINFIDPQKEIPKEIFEIRNEAIKAQVMKFSNKFGPNLDICALKKSSGFWEDGSINEEAKECKVS